MSRMQFLGFACALSVGAFGGAFVAMRPTATALAQPIQDPGGVQVQMQDWLFVPSGGLRLVNERGQVLGVIGQEGGNARLTLLDSAGLPSIVLAAGVGGQATVATDAQGGLIDLRSRSGTQRGSLVVAGQSSRLVLNSAVNAGAEVGAGTESTLLLKDARNPKGVFAQSGPEGGQVLLAGPNKTLLELLATRQGGRAQLMDGKGEPTVLLSGEGRLGVLSGKQTVWQAPPAQPQSEAAPGR